MDVVVLDYGVGEVRVMTVPKKVLLAGTEQSEQIEEWLSELGYSLGDVEWMSAEHLTVKDTRKKSDNAALERAVKTLWDSGIITDKQSDAILRKI